MFAKGRTNYQAMVEDKAESLKLLLSVVPAYINGIKKRAEEEANSVSEEYTEWDENAQKEIVRTWHPLVDTTIFDDMLCDFYASMIQRIYSFCEICMSELCRDKGSLKPKRGTTKSGHAKRRRGPILAAHYKTIQQENDLSLPEIADIWKGYQAFRIDRNRLTHKLLMKKYNEGYLRQNIDDVQTLLLSTEHAILTSKK
jgi:hypothetical protein